MSSSTFNDEDVRRYLLDLVDESEEEDISAALLDETEEKAEEIIRSAENSLIFDYIHGRLSSEEEQSFKTKFLATSFRRELFESLWLREALRLGSNEAKKPLEEKVWALLLAIPSMVPAMGAIKPAIAVQALVKDVGLSGGDSVTVTCGDDAEVFAGQVFDVFRQSPEVEPARRFAGPPIGFVTIDSVGEDFATGRYEGGAPVRVGDYVKSRPRNQN